MSRGVALFAMLLVACGGEELAASNAPVDGGAGDGPAAWSGDGAGPTTDGDGGAPLAPDGAAPFGDAAPVYGPGILLGYYAEWTGKVLPIAAIDWSALTHVAQAFALPADDGGLSNGASFPNDTLVQTAHANGVKAIVAVGGANGAFDKGAVPTTARKATVAALAALCADHGYDGIEIDWEFPNSSTIDAWVAFMDELRAALDAVRPGLTLSTTIAESASTGDVLPIASLSKLDWVSAMTYRYTGPSSAVVGPYAPLDVPSGSAEGSVSASLLHLVNDRGLSPSKVLLGLGFYGEEFKDGPPGTPISSPSKVLPIDQWTIAQTMGTAGWTLAWDPVASESSLANGSTWITYEDGTSVDAKCAFVHANGLAGAMIWHLASGVLANGTQPLVAHAAGCR